MTITALKILAMVTMFIDHIASFIPNTPQYFHWIGRISAPVFMYCSIIGYEKTINKTKYMLRLYVLNLIMGMINTILDIQYNFIGTILLIIIIIFIVDKFKNKDDNARRILSLFIAEQILFFIFIIFLTYLMNNLNYNIRLESVHIIKAFFVSMLLLDGGLFFAVFGLIMYFSNKNRKTFSIAYIIVTILCLIIYNTNIARRIFDIIGSVIDNNYLISAGICEILFGVDPHFMKTGLLYGNPQWMMIGALPFILMYNGEKGKGLKYLFYIFYPLHIIVLYFIGRSL